MTEPQMPLPTPTSGPLVSVVVATRNRAPLLRKCLDAIAAQRYPHLEVIVADDGSERETHEAYRQGAWPLGDRLRWVLAGEGGERTGPAAARNRGLAAAAGEFVAFCDDDDRWIRDDHLACAVAALESAHADFFFSNLVGSRDGTITNHVWFPNVPALVRGGLSTADPDVFAVDLATLIRGVGFAVIHPDSWLVRRRLLDRAGRFWERLSFMEDYELTMRLLDQTDRILFRRLPCVDYRLPVADSVSLAVTRAESILLENMAAQRVRTNAGKAILRRHARAREAWGLRQLARLSKAQGDGGRHFAWQGFCLYPTLGALRDCLW